jgi:hypothetical protein
LAKVFPKEVEIKRVMSTRGIFLNWIIVLCFVGARVEVSAQPLAFSQHQYSAGGTPTVADLNEDGKLEVIAATANDFSVTIWTNDGTGILGSNATVKVPYDPEVIVAADLFGHGKKDLVVGQFTGPNSNGFAIVFTNNGAGVFGSNATLYGVGSLPGDVVAADLNGDGRPDLGIADTAINNGVSTLTIYTNNGVGGFGFNAAINPGFDTGVIAAVDVNGDGSLDLVAANSYPSLSIFTNNGFGVFGSNAVLNTGTAATDLSVADVNGDGSPDLITADPYSNSISVFTNDGTGAFSLSATIGVGIGPFSVVAADLNGDGSPDLICTVTDENDGSVVPGSLTILTNNGAGVFGYNTTITVDNEPGAVQAADLNDDGKMDLIVQSPPFSRFTVLTQVPFVPPVLQIQNAGQNTSLSWSCYSSDFLVQTNLDLNPSNWVDCAYPVAINADYTNFTMSLTSAPADKLFFRLRQ